MVEIFNFIKVIFLTVIFIIIFSFMSPAINDAVNNWKSQSWASSEPLLTFLIGGANFWIFLGLFIGILGAMVYGTSIWWNNKNG